MSGLTGRFLTRDPIGYEGSEWNNYEFLEGSVFDFVDFDGLDKNPIVKPPIRVPVTPGVLPVAGGCAAADGPFPIGDAIAVGLVICAVIHDTCTDYQRNTGLGCPRRIPKSALARTRGKNHSVHRSTHA